jgi:hypothetical protein
MGRWKAYRPRGESLVLVDLDADPGEERDVAGEYPEIVEAIEARLAVLSSALAATSVERAGPTEEDKRRLRSLGYLE